MIRPAIAALLTLSFAFTCTVAQATVQRTFVSTSGDDANTASNCPATAPCRSFGAAITVTTAGGEIVPLTSGGYGAVTISKSVQIVAPLGVYAAITAASGNGITVTAGASDIVVLKGLTINGLGTGTAGIYATAFGTLHVESCTVSGFSGIGVQVDIGNTTGSAYINDVTVRNNGDTGVYLRADSGGTLLASVDHLRSEGNAQNGLIASNGATATVSASVSSGNGAAGFSAGSGLVQNLSAEVDCDGCVASNNKGPGFIASAIIGPATMRAARSVAIKNAIGFQTATSHGPPTFESLTGTNLVRGNTTNTSGTITDVTSP